MTLLRGWAYCQLGLAFLASLGSLAGATKAPHSAFKANERRELMRPIADFSLSDQSGKVFQFKRLRGKVVIAAFAYTTCPDVCPLITAALRRVQTDLSYSELAKSHLLTVTTDPEIDTPRVLAGYAKRHGVALGSWSFLTGDDATLRSVWKNFGVGVKRKARGLVDHTPLVAIVDRQGIMRFAYIGPSPDVSSMLRDIRSLLAGA